MPLQVRAIITLLAMTACTMPTIAWPATERPEDPEPSGPPLLRAYKEAYYRSQGAELVARLDDAALIRRAADSQVVFLGDVHDDADLHAWMLVLIEQLLGQREVVFCLESVGVEDESAVNAYLAGHVTMDVLRARIRARWPESWFDSEHVDAAFYREVLRRARDRGARVTALEPTPRLPLQERDAAMAANIRRAIIAAPDALLVVIVGHTHVTGPDRLRERVGLRAVAIASRLSVSLAEQLEAEPPAGRARWLVTDRDVVVRAP